MNVSRSKSMNDPDPDRDTGKPPGALVMSERALPAKLVEVLQSRMGTDARISPARENGGYKGRVIFASQRYLVQVVGQDQKQAVVHRVRDVEFVGQKLSARAESGALKSVNLQVHYAGKEAKAYVWNQQREIAQRKTQAAVLDAQRRAGDTPDRDRTQGRKAGPGGPER